MSDDRDPGPIGRERKDKGRYVGAVLTPATMALMDRLIAALDADPARDRGRRELDKLEIAVRAARARWRRKTTISDVIRLAIEQLAREMKIGGRK